MAELDTRLNTRALGIVDRSGNRQRKVISLRYRRKWAPTARDLSHRPDAQDPPVLNYAGPGARRFVMSCRYSSDTIERPCWHQRRELLPGVRGYARNSVPNGCQRDLCSF